MIFCATRACSENPDLQPDDFDKLLQLQKKYYNLRQWLRKLLKKK